MNGTYDPAATALNASDAAETASGSITCPNDGSEHDLFVSVTGADVRLHTETSGEGGMLIKAGSAGVFVARYLCKSGTAAEIPMRSDSGTGTVLSTFLRVVR